MQMRDIINLIENAEPNGEADNAVLLSIAKQFFGFDSFVRKNNDSLDFKEVAVWSVEAALLAAFEAGKASR